jgi:hypothetical protein
LGIQVGAVKVYIEPWAAMKAGHSQTNLPISALAEEAFAPSANVLVIE